jgi:hypothetical protein
MSRVAVLDKITQLESSYCHGCTKWQEFDGSKDPTTAGSYCREKCRVGAEIREYGHLLCPGFSYDRWGNDRRKRRRHP